jgi:tetratricopeptide (TPR) repeat protein
VGRAVNLPSNKIDQTSPRPDEQANSDDDVNRQIAELDRAIALNPKSADAYRNRGLLFGRKRDYDRALRDFNKALVLNPNDARSYAFRGLVWFPTYAPIRAGVRAHHGVLSECRFSADSCAETPAKK